MNASTSPALGPRGIHKPDSCHPALGDPHHLTRLCRRGKTWTEHAGGPQGQGSRHQGSFVEEAWGALGNMQDQNRLEHLGGGAWMTGLG